MHVQLFELLCCALSRALRYDCVHASLGFENNREKCSTRTTSVPPVDFVTWRFHLGVDVNQKVSKMW
jgi:hypothetical protein